MITVYKKVSNMFKAATDELDKTNGETTNQVKELKNTNLRIESLNGNFTTLLEKQNKIIEEQNKQIAELTAKVEDNSKLSEAFAKYVCSDTASIKDGTAKEVCAILNVNQNVLEQTKVGEEA